MNIKIFQIYDMYYTCTNCTGNDDEECYVRRQFRNNRICGNFKPSGIYDTEVKRALWENGVETLPTQPPW